MHIERNKELGHVLREVSIFLAGVGFSAFTLTVIGVNRWLSSYGFLIPTFLLVVVIVLGYLSNKMLAD
jgi:hypothetical protein